jgi:hypothetical protein
MFERVENRIAKVDGYGPVGHANTTGTHDKSKLNLQNNSVLSFVARVYMQ